MGVTVYLLMGDIQRLIRGGQAGGATHLQAGGATSLYRGAWKFSTHISVKSVSVNAEDI